MAVANAAGLPCGRGGSVSDTAAHFPKKGNCTAVLRGLAPSLFQRVGGCRLHFHGMPF